MTVGSTIATGLDGRVGSWQSELLNMALTHAKASLVAMVTLDVMSGSLSVFRVGELAATCWTALLVSMLLSPALCRGALCAAAFGLCALMVFLAQMRASKVLSGCTGAAAVLGGDTM